MKYKALSTSPLCTNVSPGGTCVVWNFIDNALRQPGLAPEIPKDSNRMHTFSLGMGRSSHCITQDLYKVSDSVA